MVENDQNYHLVFKQLVETIDGSRQKVMRVANTELLTTYWEIGRTILEQKEKAGWGKKVIGKLANDLRAKFPNMKGLSQRNLVYMQTFASAWPFFPFTQPPAAQLPTVGKIEGRSIPQPLIAELLSAGQTNDGSITQLSTAQLQTNENQPIDNKESLLLQVPWTHHMVILDKTQTFSERIFYIKEAIKNGWTANMLKVNIETRLHERKGSAITTNLI